MTYLLVLLYLAFAVAANLLVNHYGVEATPYVAFAVVGPILTIRDQLHARWEVSNDWLFLWGRMLPLIILGSALTYLLAPDAGKIALASGVAFAGAGIVDTLIFEGSRGWGFWERVTTSNIVSGAVDSVVFLWIAFGDPWSDGVTFRQWVSKIAGGAVWVLFTGFLRR